MSETSRGGVYEQRERTSLPAQSGFGSHRGTRRAAGEAPEERRDGRGRWSAKRKYAAMLRLPRGEDLETLSRELGVTAATLSGWRDQFLEGGAANLKAREADVDNQETQRLKSLVADLSTSNELLREKIHRMEAGRPLVWRRPKP